MINNYIFIPIELPVRELSSSAMLASFLASKGMSVVIGAQADVKSLALSSTNSIYLDKTLYSAHNDFYNKLHDRNISIFCDDIEASGCHVPELYAQARFSKENLDLVEGIFFWGKDDFNAVNNNYDLDIKKCHKKGSFRAYFWKYFSDNIPSNIKKKDQITKKYKEFVFIPSNFGGSMRPDGIDAVINQAKENYPQLTNKIIQRIEHTEKRRVDFVNAIIKLVDDHSDINFVFRPHPNEDKTKWNNIFPEKHNFFIEYEGTVTEYILGCKALIHSGCTSAFEAYYYNKPCIAYVPDRNAKWDNWQANAMSQEVDNYDLLSSSLKIALSTNKRIKTTNPFYAIEIDLLDYYFEIFANTLKGKIRKSKNIINTSKIFRIKRAIKAFFKIDENFSERKFDKNDLSNLCERLSFFNQSISLESVNIKQMTDKVVLLTKD